MKTNRINANYRIWTVSFHSCLAAQLLITSGAHAQLSTSPDAVQLPKVTVTSPESAQAPIATPQSRSQPTTAPRAGDQRTSPAASRRQPQASPPQQPSTISDQADAIDKGATAVSATGVNQPLDSIASSVTVIPGSAIEARQARNAPELLSTVPGVQVVQTGGPGGTTSIFVRGTNSNHTKVIIDGIDVGNPVDANRAFDFGLLTTFDLGRVEVLRGPQSGLYGADAIGGVVVLYTQDATKPFEIEALAEAGSFGTINEAISARGKSNNLRYAFSASHSEVDGFAVVPERLIPPGFAQRDSEYENWTFSTKLGIDVSPNVAFNVAARYSDTEYQFQSNPTDRKLTTSRSDQLSTRAETVLTNFGGRLQTIAGISYVGVDSDTISDIGATTAAGFGTRVKGDARTIAEVTPGLTVTLGGDWQNERLTQPTTAFAPGLAVEEANTGAYVQAQFEPVRNLFLTGNFRFDDNESFGEATTWRFAPAAVIDATGTTFRASFGTAFKAPSLSQRFQDFPDPFFPFIANRNLTPETSRGMDVGFEQALIGGRARTGLTYFRNTIEDLIEFVFDPTLGPFGGGTVVNVGKAKTSGIEVFTSADITETLRVRADYTYTEAQNAETGRDLLRRPRNKATLSIGWQPVDRLLLTSSLIYIGERFDIDRETFDTIRQSSFTTVNIAADYKVNEHVSLIGRVDNLLDKEYEDPNGFQRPGIGAYAGVRLRN
ncbi:MAG: TonB-dependent receptor [Hyphomicrobium aestuarii]|nr:TonB-dependent receptor [Hyphomicrobium aestuarii]